MSKSFASQIVHNDEDALVVDALNLAFRYKHKKQRNFADDYLKTVRSLATSYHTGKIIITADSGSSSYRKDLYPEYKIGRKEKRDEQTEQEAEDFELFFADYLKTLDVLKENFLTLQYKGVEADDLAAYITVNKKKFGLERIWLISSDRDWDLLINEQVSRFSYVTRKEITYDNWLEHYDYNIEDHISIKCLMGDSGDSIPGVEGIGPKRAQELVAKYGTTFDIIASMPLPGKLKYIQSLNAFGADKLMLNYQLMDLVSYCAEAIGKENCEDIHAKFQEYYG